MGRNKKRVLSLLVAAAMVASMMPAAGMPVAEAAASAPGVCAACNKTVQWTKYDGTEAVTVENEHKHFYLEEDVTETVEEKVLINIGAEGSVCFHLNGNTLTVDSGYFWLSTTCTDYKSTLNIIGTGGGEIRFSGGNVVYQNYGIVNIYGGTYTPTDGTKNFADCVTRGFTLVDAKVNADLICLSRATVVTLKGAATVKNIKPWHLDANGEAVFGKVNFASNWAGSAALDVPRQYITDGQLNKTYFYYSGSVPAGAVKLTSGEKLTYRDGALQLYGRLILDSAGKGMCLVCNESVQWTEFTGQAITGTDGEHLHYYMTQDIDTSVLGADAPQYLIYLYPKQMMCLHLNGHTLTTGSGIYIRGGDDASTALNIIGYGGEYVYTADRTSVGIELRYDLLRLLGGAYTYAPAEGKSGTLMRIHRYPSFTDATINGTVLIAARYVNMEVDGSTTISQINYNGYSAQVKFKTGWTGETQLKLPTNAVTNGVVSAERVVCVPKPDGELGGKLTLSTGEKLSYRDGKLVVNQLQVNSNGYANCGVCNASVKWTKLDGTKAFTVTDEHQHFYLEEDTDYIRSIADMLTLKEGGKACLHLNGYTLMVYDAAIRLADDSTALNIIAADGKIGYTERTLIQQEAGAVNLYGGTYSPVYGIPFISAGGAVKAQDAKVEGDMIARNDAAVFNLCGATCTAKINLDDGGKVKLADNWTGTATLDMETADLVGGKVPTSRVSFDQTPAGTVGLASGRTLQYRDGVLAKPVDLALDAENRGLCPLCKKTVQWTALDLAGMNFEGSTAQHHHIYLADNVSSTEKVELLEAHANHKVCLHLNGYDLTTGSIIHAAGGEINIYGHGSNYTFTGEQAGGNVGLYAYSGGTMNLYGGTYKFAPAQGAENTKMLVADSVMRLQDVTIHNDVIMDSNSGQVILAGETDITGLLRFGTVSYLRGKVLVEESFAGTVTLEAKTGMVSSGVFREVRGTAEGDYTGTLKLSDGKRLVNNGGVLKVALIADPVSWKVLDALPVANNSMTEQELRQLCVDFFRWTLSFGWTPKENAHYQNKTTNPVKHFYTGTVYGGTPYITATTGTIYTAMEYYDPLTGVLNISGDAKQTLMNFSNQCSGSAFWAWNRVCTSAVYTDTATTLQYYGCLPVGPYAYPETLTRWEVSDISTLKICQANGAQTMYESYALMKPADGILTVRPEMTNYPANGHNRMIVSNPVVVRNSDGTINGEKSYVYYIDQDGEYNADTQADGTSYTHIGVDTKFTFAEMHDEAYIPFTFAELVGQKPVDKSVTQMDYAGKTVTVSQLKDAVVTSNYSISDITVTVKDAAGKQVYRKLTSSNVYEATRPLHLKVNVSVAVDADALAAFVDGTHTVEVSARIGTGEKPVVYSGILSAGAAAKISESGTVWYETIEEAVADYTDADFAAGSYMKLFRDADISLTGGSYYIDAAGGNVDITGTGKLYAFDSENNDFDGFGSWTVGDGIELTRDFVAPDGSRYLVTTKDGVTTAHALVLELAGVLVNTDKAGLSYEAQYTCDDVLSEMISAYGIIASLKDMPGAQLGHGDARTLLHNFQPDDLHQVLSQSSYVYGIFKDGRTAAENAQNGKTKIYANPYIQLDVDGDGEEDVIVGDTENVGKKAGNAWSLYDALKEIDDNWASYADQQAAVKAFYSYWADKGMSQYGFTNIA